MCCDDCMPRGKQNNPDYAGVTAQIPRSLKRRFASKLAFYDDLDVNIALERLIALWVDDAVDIGDASDAPAPQQTVNTTPPQTGRAGDRAPLEQGDDLGDLLERAGLSQAEFARRIGVTRATVSRYVTGARRPPADVIAAARAILEDGAT